MKDEFLSYYNRELAHIRHLGAEFAKAYPKVAEQLQITQESIEDPHVLRLIESFAFLNARIRQKLEDEFPEITEAFLSILYPHYLSPIPSFSVVQFKPKLDLQKSFVIYKGTMLETDLIEGEACKFQTCYETVLHPLQVKQVALVPHRRQAPPIANTFKVNAVLQLQIRSYVPLFVLNTADNPLFLRFFLRGAAQQMFSLYELLTSQIVQVAVSYSPDPSQAVFLGPQALKPIGFEQDQNLLPYPSRAFLGYRLLTEFFAFPHKFLFLELTNLPLLEENHPSQDLYCYFYLSKNHIELEEYLGAENFALGCTPVVNLFPHQAAPLTIQQFQPEYPIVPSIHHPQAYEIYDIQEVTALYRDGRQKPLSPLYGLKHAVQQNQFWYASRRPSVALKENQEGGTDLFMAVVDTQFKPSKAEDYVLDIETICCNRNLPSRLPFGGNQPHLQLSELEAPITHIECLVRPTKTYRIQTEKLYWALISHLTLNKMSLADNKEGCDALREILKLYNFSNTSESRLIIESILSLETRQVLARDPNGALNFCQGIEILLELDQDRFNGTSAYLFASVLERFFSLYVNINSFTQLTVFNKNKRRILYTWKPQLGTQPLI